MNNWKSRASAAVVDAPKVESADEVAFRSLKAGFEKLDERDRTFAISLLNGFTKYHSFTERQRPYVQKLIEKALAPVVERAVADARARHDLDLSAVPAGRYAVETRRIQVDKPADGKWANWTFVKDGSEYTPAARRIAGGRPEWAGCVEVQGSPRMLADRADLEAIIANPMEACAQYGRITSTCGICGRTLEDPESVARGIGPVCAGRF